MSKKKQFSVAAAAAPEESKPVAEVVVETESTEEQVVESVEPTEAEVRQLAEERQEIQSLREETQPVFDPVQEAKDAKVTAHIDNSGFDLDKVKAKLSSSGLGLLGIIENYMVEMVRRRPIVEARGVQLQVQLYRTIRSIIARTSDEDFQVLFPALLALFNEYREDVFHEDLINRFSASLTLQPAEREGYRRVVNMLMVLADPQTRRKNLSTVDLVYTTKFDFTEIATNRVINFFEKYK